MSSRPSLSGLARPSGWSCTRISSCGHGRNADAALKLARLPDRTPVRLTLTITPKFHVRLADYAAAYEAAYGKAEPFSELIPAMLAALLDSDRGFTRRGGR